MHFLGDIRNTGGSEMAGKGPTAQLCAAIADLPRQQMK